MSKHQWLLDVLADLYTYTDQNDLEETRQSIRAAILKLMEEDPSLLASPLGIRAISLAVGPLA